LALGSRGHATPAKCFSYAHTNYVILGEVLHLATGRDVADLIRDRILKPLCLRETRSDSTAFIPQPVLHAFTSERGTYEGSTCWNPSWTVARGAAMTSTIEDVRRSAIAIGEGTVLLPASHDLQLAFTDVPPRTAPGRPHPPPGGGAPDPQRRRGSYFLSPSTASKITYRMRSIA